jgi:hypothetical protein
MPAFVWLAERAAIAQPRCAPDRWQPDPGVLLQRLQAWDRLWRRVPPSAPGIPQFPKQNDVYGLSHREEDQGCRFFTFLGFCKSRSKARLAKAIDEIHNRYHCVTVTLTEQELAEVRMRVMHEKDLPRA